MYKITCSDINFEAEAILAKRLEETLILGEGELFVSGCELTTETTGYEISCIKANMSHFPVYVEYVDFVIEDEDGSYQTYSGYLSDIQATPAQGWPPLGEYGHQFFFKIRTQK